MLREFTERRETDRLRWGWKCLAKRRWAWRRFSLLEAHVLFIIGSDLSTELSETGSICMWMCTTRSVCKYVYYLHMCVSLSTCAEKKTHKYWMCSDSGLGTIFLHKNRNIQTQYLFRLVNHGNFLFYYSLMFHHPPLCLFYTKPHCFIISEP